MNFDPISLTGPQFLKLYVLCFVAIAFYRFVRRKRWQASLGSGPKVKWAPYELAFLAGGHQRVGEVAMLELLRMQVLSVGADGGTVTLGKKPPADLEEPESAMHAAVARGPVTLRGQCRSFTAPGAIVTRLLHHRMLASPDLKPVTPQDARFGVLPLALLLGTGLVRLVMGMSHGRPVGYLILLCCITLVTILAWIGSRDVLTGTGRQLLAEQTRRNAALRTTARRRSDSLSHNDFVMAAGLFGPAIVLNGELAWLRHAFAPPPSNTDGSGGSCSSGGSCGSSCGGGCGGCGG